MSRLGIILAGGQSRRMGTPKALLRIQGKAVISTIIEAMSPLCEQVVISADNQELYEFTGLPVVPDQYTGAGPLAGLHAALSYSGQEWNLVCSCDHPFVSSLLFGGLIAAAEQAGEEVDAIIPFWEGELQPLAAVYRGRALARLADCLENGERRVQDWTSRLNIKQASLEELVDTTGTGWNKALFNMNNPEDYEEALRLAESLPSQAELH